MTHLWVLASGFFFANFMCLIAIWNNYSYNSVDPKYINSSYDPKKKEELDSLLLKSVEKYIKKYFNIKSSIDEAINYDLKENTSFFLGEPLSNNETLFFREKLKNYQTIKNTESAKFSMFLDKEQKNIIILKISNEGDKMNKFDSKAGEVILFSIPIDIFLPKKQNKQENNINSSFSRINLQKSLIKQCWYSKFFGRIIGAVASADKTKLSIFYRVVKGHTITYRIRYFHNIECLNENIENSDKIVIDNFKDYIDGSTENNKTKKKLNNFIENYFEISENIEKKENNYEDYYKSTEFNDENLQRKRNYNEFTKSEKVFKNYFDDDSYDDFLLKGNTPITAMAIKENVIAYARDLDYRQYYILKREKKTFSNFTNEEAENNTKNNSTENFVGRNNTDNNITNTKWKVSSLGPKIDRNVQPFFHTNSLKFMDDPLNDYRLIHIFVSINNTDISSYGYFRLSNHTEFDEDLTELTFTSIPFFKVFFINEIMKNNEEFILEKSIKKLKKYLQPTLFSNNFNSQDMIFEFTKSYLLLMHSNITSGNVHFIRMRPDTKEKISKLHSDVENENIIIVEIIFNFIFFFKKLK